MSPSEKQFYSFGVLTARSHPNRFGLQHLTAEDRFDVAMVSFYEEETPPLPDDSERRACVEAFDAGFCAGLKITATFPQ